MTIHFQKIFTAARQEVRTFYTKLVKAGIISRRPPKKRNIYARRLLAACVVIIALFSYLTNPFVRFSLVSDPYRSITIGENNQFSLNTTTDLLLKDEPFFNQLAFFKSGWHIFTNKISGGKRSKQTTVDQIIAQIHQERFNPEYPYLISGDHFTVLYPRSLGIFYHSLLDPRTALDSTDWQNRQLIYLKTLAYALQVYSQSDRLSTTIVPVGPRSVALVNFYAPPSDTLYSLLFALQRLRSANELVTNYPFTAATEVPPLQTSAIGNQLLTTYHTDLKRHLDNYLRDVVDPATGLVRKDILLSGTKDIAKHQSSFYDNVMVWKTQQLAQDLGLVDRNELYLADLKQRILKEFWVPNQGHFLADLSTSAIQEKQYSSEWMIAYQTGFLSPAVAEDLPYLEKNVEYIQRNAIDQPFGLQYHPDPRPEQLYGLVKLMAPDYGSTAIWSNWGMEYIKLLAHLSQVTGKELYLEQADKQLSAYAYNIKRYRGYPEVYNSSGDFFRQTLYKSVRQTGWIVSFEQAQAMVESSKDTFTQK
jgi:hypothetical protein